FGERKREMKVFDLTGKTTVVTGGASGIGRSISTLFARQGAHVQVLDMNEAEGAALQHELRQEGFRADFRLCNVADGTQVQALFAEIASQVGLHILVNNAGIAHIGNIEQVEEADLDRLFQVNVKGVFHCAKAAISHMKGAGGGVILNMASVASLVA